MPRTRLPSNDLRSRTVKRERKPACPLMVDTPEGKSFTDWHWEIYTTSGHGWNPTDRRSGYHCHCGQKLA